MKICKHKNKSLEECTVYNSDDGFPICGSFKDSSKVPDCFEECILYNQRGKKND